MFHLQKAGVVRMAFIKTEWLGGTLSMQRAESDISCPEATY